MIANQLREIIQKMVEHNEDPFPEIEGQDKLKRQIMSALISGRNIIIEGYPGVGKTTIAKAVAKLLPNIRAVKGCPFHCNPDDPVCPKCKSEAGRKKEIEINGTHRFIRIQGSPDLTVEDLLGDIDPALAFEYGPTDPRAFKPGKLLRANRGVLFFDELNRCPERLQNALLQVLEEGEATISGYSVTYPADFILIATMNPSEFAGTERLSDVLLDRFDVVMMEYPENVAIEKEIVKKKGIKLLPVPDDILTTLVSIVRATRGDDRIESPAGVRATLGLYERSQAIALLKRKKFVELEDVKEVAHSVIVHRIKLAPKVRHTQTPEQVVSQIIEEVIKGSGPPEDSSASVVMGMVNHGIQALDSAHIARMLINNLQAALDLFGKQTVTELTGFSELDLKRRENQFQHLSELQNRIDEKIEKLKEDGLLDNEGNITDKGLELAIEEALKFEGFSAGDHATSDVGRDVIVGLRNKFKGSYRDISFRATFRKAMMHGHHRPVSEDWVGYVKRKGERVDFLFMIDSSGSMKGSKIDACKKAALSLADHCRRKGDRLAVISFSDKVEIVSPLDQDPRDLAVAVMGVMPLGTTDIAKALEMAQEVLSQAGRSRHAILITDALPTQGDKPISDALDQAEKLSSQGITLSVVGIGLDAEGESTARELAGIGKGKFYQVSAADQIKDKVLTDVTQFK